jgi:hypothetical protein
MPYHQTDGLFLGLVDSHMKERRQTINMQGISFDFFHRNDLASVVDPITSMFCTLSFLGTLLLEHPSFR